MKEKEIILPDDLEVKESNSATTQSECQSACGSCAYYGMEDAYGYGWCVKHDEPRGCSEEACGYFVDRDKLKKKTYMKKGTIEEAADNYAANAKPSFTNGDFDRNAIADAFERGAEWRVNTVWHYPEEEPEIGRLILLMHEEDENGRMFHPAIVEEDDDWHSSAKEGAFLIWAYVSDLLP